MISMIGTRLKKVILVAPDIFPEQLIANYNSVRHVNSISHIFPAIFELTPDLVVFDFDFMGKDMEKTLRRIKANKFYDKIKIFCYKSDPHTKVDGLLKVLGVDHFIYKEDLVKAPKGKSVLNTMNTIIDASIIKMVASVSN